MHQGSSGSSNVDFEFVAATHPNGSANDFEFAVVKPVKQIFISRLPPGIGQDVLMGHVLKRLPGCANVSILNGNMKDKYSSALMPVGGDDNSFNTTNSQSFWPPGTESKD